jgi:hypothetical protein
MRIGGRTGPASYELGREQTKKGIMEDISIDGVDPIHAQSILETTKYA